MAWGTPTNLGTSNAILTITAIASAPAGALIVVATQEFMTASHAVGTVTDNAAAGANSYSSAVTLTGSPAGGEFCVTGMFYAYNVNALASGKVITYTSNAGADLVAIELSAFYVTGELTASDPLDAATINSSTGSASTQPTVTSGTPAVSGELFVGVVGQIIGTTPTFSQAGGWSVPPNEIDDATQSLVAGGNLINAGTGTETYAPTLATNVLNQWVDLIVGFKVAPDAVAASLVFQQQTISANTITTANLKLSVHS